MVCKTCVALWLKVHALRDDDECRSVTCVCLCAGRSVSCELMRRLQHAWHAMLWRMHGACCLGQYVLNCAVRLCSTAVRLCRTVRLFYCHGIKCEWM